jgi:xylan 1,4-beta-xylosidase
MPAPAPGRTISVFWWKANITPPQSYAKWDALITALVQHWTDRYGADEVKTWYFEIWNEPNIPNFFSPNNPQKRKEEYFELYTHTAKAVRAVNPAYRVGGPAGAGPVWTKDLLAYCAAQQVPIDFISFHAYGLGGGPGGLDVEGHKRLYVSANLDAPSRGAHSQDQIIAQSPFPHLPVELTEWSSSYSNHDPVHDTYFEAPYILEQLKHTETLGAMSYWTFTDIFEESGPPKTPFEGGFGLINLQGIKKAAFFAYQFLHQLGDTELQNTDPRSWICRDGKGGVQALIFDLTDPRHPIRESDQEFFRRVIIPPAKPPVTLRLTSLPPGLYHLITCRIGYEENDAYTAYLKMGAPSQLSPPQVQQLKSLATGQPVEEKDVTVPTSGQWEEPFSMRENEVVFAKLVPVTSAATTSP